MGCKQHKQGEIGCQERKECSRPAEVCGEVVGGGRNPAGPERALLVLVFFSGFQRASAVTPMYTSRPRSVLAEPART